MTYYLHPRGGTVFAAAITYSWNGIKSHYSIVGIGRPVGSFPLLYANKAEMGTRGSRAQPDCLRERSTRIRFADRPRDLSLSLLLSLSLACAYFNYSELRALHGERSLLLAPRASNSELSMSTTTRRPTIRLTFTPSTSWSPTSLSPWK